MGDAGNDQVKKTVYIQVTDSNRIKYEQLSEFSDSLFLRVYAKAFHMLGNLLKENDQFTCITGEKDQIYNVIAFLGERGMGKTSAMLSFAASLENDFNGKDGNSNERVNLEKIIGKWDCLLLKEPLYFSVLPYIDATMLEKREGIFDVVLAKMWDRFEQSPCDNRVVRKFEGLKNEVRERFLKVRECYLVQRKISKDTFAEEREISTLNTLHKLAGSINLREEFKQLVDKYLEFLSEIQNCSTNKHYLVICVDDIDMGIKNTHELLEEIRRFLMIPRVIILLTADWKRLVRICSNYEEKTYGAGDNEEREQFINNYLGKVLPHNKRIYMPDFREPDGELKPNYKIELKMGDELIQLNEKESIAYIYSKYLKINLDTVLQERHILQNDSLRSLVNYFSDFIEMVVANKSREQEIFRNQLLQWMKNDLRYRVAEKIKQKELRDFWDHLFTTEIRTLGEEICKYLITLLRKESGTEAYINFCESTSYGYGAILYGCILLQKKEFLYNTFCEAIILFVTWIQACNNTQKSQINWLEDRSFGNWIGVIDHVENHYVFSGDVGLNVVPMSKLELEMEGDLEFESILLEDTDADAKKEKFSTWFEKLFHENIEAIYGFQTLMYAFAGSDTEKLEDVWLHVQVDWSGNDGTGKGLVLNQLKKEIEEEEYIDTFMVRVSPWMSECTFGWMNFIQNSKTDQFLNPEDWLKTRIAQPIMGELEKRFRRKHADVDIPEDCFDIENINLKGISLALISEAYKTWLEENKDQEILPYDSPQVLYNIGKRLEALENLSFKSGNGMIISAEKYTLIKKELDRRYSSHANEWNYAKAFSTCPYIDVMSDMWTIDDHEKIFDKLFPMKES